MRPSAGWWTGWARRRTSILTRVKALAGFPGEVFEQHADELALPAPRPRGSALTSVFLHEVGIDPLPPLDVALKEMTGGLHD